MNNLIEWTYEILERNFPIKVQKEAWSLMDTIVTPNTFMMVAFPKVEGAKETAIFQFERFSSDGDQKEDFDLHVYLFEAEAYLKLHDKQSKEDQEFKVKI